MITVYRRIGCGFVFMFLAVFLTVPFLNTSTAWGQEVKTIKMASVNAFSGKAAAWGYSQDRGMRMAAKKVNDAGGLKIGGQSYQWEIKSYDNRYIPAEAVSSMKRAVADGCTFMCTLGGAVTFPLFPMINENKIITLAAIAGGADFTNPNNPYLFRTMPSSDLLLSIHGVKLYERLGVKKLATLMADNVLGRSDGKALKAALANQKKGDLLVAEEYIATDTSDFTPVLTRILAKKPDHIEGGAWPTASLGLLIKQARQLGYNGAISNMTGAPEMKGLLETGGKKNIEGLFMARVWPSDQLPSEEFRKFWADYEKAYKETPGANCWEGHVAFEFLSAAIQKSQSLDPDVIVETMRDLKMQTMMGELKLIGKDNPLLPGYGINNQFDAPMPITRISDGRPVIFN